jgi:hypothetical protein
MFMSPPLPLPPPPPPPLVEDEGADEDCSAGPPRRNDAPLNEVLEACDSKLPLVGGICNAEIMVSASTFSVWTEFTGQPVIGVNTREEWHWSHAC